MAKDANEFYKNKVKVFVALAPCTKMTHATFRLISMGAALYDEVIT